MSHTSIHRFGKYHTGPWQYEEQAGVGLALAGAPTDVHAFIEALQTAGCSPVATRRVLDELEAGRTKYTTVRSTLDFAYIGDALAAAGVTMTIVPPAEADDPTYDHVALLLLQDIKVDLSQFTDEERHIIERRRQHAQASIERIPHDFGKHAMAA